MRLLALALGLTVTTSLGWPGGMRPPQPSQVSGGLLVVDVSVTRSDGEPVRGLQAGDFSVVVDGRPRRVASVRFIDAASPRVPGAPTGADAGRAAGEPPPFSSNEAGLSGRVVLLVVDEGGIPIGGLRRTAESIEALLEGFGPEDRIGVAALPGPGMVVGFTSDRRRVAEAIKGLSGGASWGGAAATHVIAVLEAFAISRGDARVYDSVVRRECAGFTGEEDQKRCPGSVRAEARRIVAEAGSRVRQFTAAFGTLLERLRPIDAAKVIIVFSEGLASPEAPQALQALAPEVAAVRAAIHAVRLDRAVLEPERAVSFAADDRTATTASLDALAGIGRGIVVTAAGSDDPLFRRLARELSAYYLLGLEPDAEDRDGKLHRVEVSVRTQGATVRARPAFVARDDSGDSAALLAATLLSPVPATALPIRVMAHNLADESPDKVRVLVVGEIDSGLQGGAAVLVGFRLVDPSGNAAASFGQRMQLHAGRSGRLTFVGGASVVPGRYTLQFAAVRGSRPGSIEHPVEARLRSAAALRIGDLVLADLPARGAMLAPPVDASLAGDSFVCYLQIGHDPQATADLVIDIVKREDGPALLSVPLTLAPSNARATAVQVTIDGRLLPPGAYGARLSVPASGEPATFVRFSLARTPGARPGGAAVTPAAARASRARAFKAEDVLDASVLGPFLDELSAHASEGSRTAIERARAGRFDEALEALQATAATDPTGPFIRGLAHLANNRPQPASEAFREAVRASPDFLVGAFYLGACYAAGGRPEQAVNAWQTSLAGLGRFPAVYRILGEALLEHGEAERAVTVLSRGASKWPEDARLGARLLEAAIDAGRHDEALAQAARVAEQEAADPELLFLAMQAIFEAAMATSEPAGVELRRRLEHLRDLYVRANGPRRALVDEWAAYIATSRHAPGP